MWSQTLGRGTQWSDGTDGMRRGTAALAHPVAAGGTFVRLADGETWSHVPVPGGLRITGVSGDLWVTQEGDARDTTVSDGERFVTRSTGKVVVEALGDATFRVEGNHEEYRGREVNGA